MDIIKNISVPKGSMILPVIIILAIGCKKEIPDPFARFNNQLVCKINGGEWRLNENRYSGFYVNPFANRKYIYLVYSNGNQAIRFHINPPYRPGKIYLNHDTHPASTFPEDYASFLNTYGDLAPDEFYVTNASDTGEIDFITMDTINKKIKAKFFFTGKDSRSGKKIAVTDGYLECHQ
jgi:hypothetical protein